MKNPPPEFVFLGGLREDYCITHDGRTINGALGGNAVYAAVGARLWSSSVGILGRVGSNFPQSWLEMIGDTDIDVRGITVIPETLDTRTFYAYLSLDERTDTQPALHYRRIGRPLPKALIDYESSTFGQDQRVKFSSQVIRPEDVPAAFHGARGIHLGPADYLTHSTISYRFQRHSDALITLDPSERYMTPSFRDELPRLLHGIDAFIPSEMEARAFFPSAETDLWQIADAYAAMGPQIVIIKLGAAGQILLDRGGNQRWRIPAYPARVSDVTGAGDAYCGGFLVGLATTGDAREAALYGSVSASLVIEGTGALYALQAAPGLAQARLASLRSAVKLS